jgi:hypothetical protein
VTATLQVRYQPGEDEDRLNRLVSALNELAVALGLDEPPAMDIGDNYSFYGISAPELREKLARVQTDTHGLFDGVTDDSD